MAPITRSTIKASRGRCHFLRLPTELRLEIYEHTFPTYNANLQAKEVISPPLLRTNNFIRHEMSRLYFKHLRKVVDHQDDENMMGQRKVLDQMKEELNRMNAGFYDHRTLDKLFAEQDRLLAEGKTLIKSVRRLIKEADKYRDERYEMRRRSRRQARGLRDLKR